MPKPNCPYSYHDGPYTISLRISDTAEVSELKAEIARLTLYPAHQLRLFHCSKLEFCIDDYNIKDDHSIDDYSMIDGSTIYLAFKR